MQVIFHIYNAKKRTTVSVDSILSEMLAIKLGFEPDTQEANKAVREWIQTEFDKMNSGSKTKWSSASQWIRRKLIASLVDKKLSEKWDDWRLQ